ncbi:MAG: hypothetical protein ACYTJ0_20460 [Planctomycetota bacterium]|jgi:hypothetical protein
MSSIQLSERSRRWRADASRSRAGPLRSVEHANARNERARARSAGSPLADGLSILPDSVAALAGAALARRPAHGSFDEAFAARIERLHDGLADLAALVESGAELRPSRSLPAFDADEEQAAALLLELLAASEALGLRLADAAVAMLAAAR